jgi:hypothetical protein
VDHGLSTPAFNATHRPHRTVLPFHRNSDCPCSRPWNDHNKGQDLSSHHSLPVDDHILQAFNLRNPSSQEVT